jgi:hypothetical protein
MKIFDQGSANSKHVKQRDISDAIELLSSEEQRALTQVICIASSGDERR